MNLTLKQIAAKYMPNDTKYHRFAFVSYCEACEATLTDEGLIATALPDGTPILLRRQLDGLWKVVS